MLTATAPTKAAFAAYNLPSAVRWMLDKATCQQSRVEDDNVSARFVFEGSIPFRMLQELRKFLAPGTDRRCVMLENTETAMVRVNADLPTYRSDTTVTVRFTAMYAPGHHGI